MKRALAVRGLFGLALLVACGGEAPPAPQARPQTRPQSEVSSTLESARAEFEAAMSQARAAGKHELAAGAQLIEALIDEDPQAIGFAIDRLARSLPRSFERR